MTLLTNYFTNVSLREGMVIIERFKSGRQNTNRFKDFTFEKMIYYTRFYESNFLSYVVGLFNVRVNVFCG